MTEAGYRPEFGARELRRLIRTELENRLAKAMLKGDFKPDDTVAARYDRDAGKVVLKKRAGAKKNSGVASKKKKHTSENSTSDVQEEIQSIINSEESKPV